MLPRVLFVSKSVAPPFSDGTQCLVRDIASHVQRVRPIVLSSRRAADDGAELGFPPGVELAPVYAGAGSHAPALRENLRAAAWLLARSRADVWHFLFAPNPRTTRAGRFLRRARGVPVLQTIASPPRSFERCDRLLFGEIVVAQSEWTRAQILASCAAQGLAPPALRVIVPPVPLALARSRDAQARARAALGIAADAPLFVYPGDLETSSGARFCAELAPALAERVPGAVLVFAYRKKTPAAEGVADALRAALDPRATRVVSSVADLLALIASARAVLFPVDDLWGKVDIPIVLLESMVLGTPVAVLGQGPLCELEVARLDTLDGRAWLELACELGTRPELAARLAAAAASSVRARHDVALIARAYEELYLELAGTRPGRLGLRRGAGSARAERGSELPTA